MLHLNRLLISVPLLAFYSVACGDPADAVGTGGTGTTAGAAAVTAGSSSTSGGSGSAGTASVVVTLAGSGQALGGGDQGMLFTSEGSVPIMPVEMGGTGSGGSNGIPGDGNVAKSTLEGSIKGSATFTQVGEDVQLVVEFTSGCADGNHRFSIHDGGSCDSDETDGDPWSPRGTGLGPDAGIPCSGGKGKLEYTRKGDDKTKNLTIADHNPETDLTTHVVIVSDEKSLTSRASCGNFFF